MDGSSRPTARHSPHHLPGSLIQGHRQPKDADYVFDHVIGLDIAEDLFDHEASAIHLR